MTLHVPIDAWLVPEPETRQEALAPLDADRGWRLGVLATDRARWVNQNEAPGELLAGADGRGGPWLIRGAGDELRAEPVNQTQVFRELCSIGPALRI